MAKTSAQITHAPSPARDRYGLRNPLFDEETLKRADDVLAELSSSFSEWLDKEVANVQAARLAAQASGWSNELLDTLAGAAHDLKGVGSTYGYPITTDLSALLCRILECDEGKLCAQRDPDLICAHVDAIRAAVRQGVKSRSEPIGKALYEALEAKVEALNLPRL
jgi:hypothetical protein